MKKFFKKNISIVTNLIIIAVIMLVGLLTVDFNSQYVFGVPKDEAIYHGNKNNNNISLMVNVYWGNEYIEPMLDLFKSYEVKTTFFVGGSWVEKFPDLFMKIVDDGHEIGNHGYFHKDHKKLNYEQNQSEISVTHKVVKEVSGIEMFLFAPPSGAFSKTTLNVASELNYKTIMWTKDTIDWRDKDETIILKRATNNVQGGDLILMHPTEHTAKALKGMLEYYKKNNLVVNTVSNTLK